MKPLSWIIGGGVVTLVVACAVIWSRNVEVIVPKDFRGLIRVRPNPSAASPTMGWFKLVVEVPPSGELFLPSLDVLRRLHRQRSSFSDGSSLPFVFPGDSFEGVAFQVMNTPPTQQVFYYVGTRDELIEYLKVNRQRLYSVVP